MTSIPGTRTDTHTTISRQAAPTVAKTLLQTTLAVVRLVRPAANDDARGAHHQPALNPNPAGGIRIGVRIGIRIRGSDNLLGIGR